MKESRGNQDALQRCSSKLLNAWLLVHVASHLKVIDIHVSLLAFLGISIPLNPVESRHLVNIYSIYPFPLVLGHSLKTQHLNLLTTTHQTIPKIPIYLPNSSYPTPTYAPRSPSNYPKPLRTPTKTPQNPTKHKKPKNPKKRLISPTSTSPVMSLAPIKYSYL